MNTEPTNPDEPVFDEAQAQEAVDDLMQAMSEETGENVGEPETGNEPVDEVTMLKNQIAELEKSALRHQADLENFRKRSRAQVQEQLKYASLPLISQLLESVDNLNRATEMALSLIHI